MSRAERAKEYFMKGYACSQAVVLAFSDLIEVSEAELKKLSLPFGGGLGRLRLTCGAVSGMAIVIGSLFAKEENSPDNKKNTYEIVRELCGKFQEENGSLICSELLSAQKRPCAEIVYSTARILEEYLIENGKI